MTWKDFKKCVEDAGVKDDSEIGWIDAVMTGLSPDRLSISTDCIGQIIVTDIRR